MMTGAVLKECYRSHLRRWGLTPLLHLVYQSCGSVGPFASLRMP
nr:MAG TPA: hypothetical protein [Caudoviricetes sp.]